MLSAHFVSVLLLFRFHVPEIVLKRRKAARAAKVRIMWARFPAQNVWGGGAWEGAPLLMPHHRRTTFLHLYQPPFRVFCGLWLGSFSLFPARCAQTH